MSKYMLLDIVLSLFPVYYSISGKTKRHDLKPEDLGSNSSSTAN